MGHYSDYFEQKREEEEKARFIHLKTMLNESIQEVLQQKNHELIHDILWFIDNYKGFEHFKSMVKDITRE